MSADASNVEANLKKMGMFMGSAASGVGKKKVKNEAGLFGHTAAA